MTRGRRVAIGAMLGSALALILVSAFVAALNTTAATADELIPRDGLIVLLIFAGLAGAAVGAALADFGNTRQ